LPAKPVGAVAQALVLGAPPGSVDTRVDAWRLASFAREDRVRHSIPLSTLSARVLLRAHLCDTVCVNGPRQLHFEWDTAKALSNLHKHGVDFMLAASIFRDPRIQSMFDEPHSTTEERWIALGLASNGSLLVVVHTWTEVDPVNVNIRIISARKATGPEEGVYKDSL
jgi:uncharacterized protein